MTQSAASGRVVGGRYRLIDKLGSGGFGRVWRARDETLRVDVAVKEVWLPPAISTAEHSERLRRAEREARNAARLRDQPTIVTVHDVVIEDDVPWIVMQLVAGRSLDEHVRAHGPLPADRAVDIARALLRALGAAHDAGIVHRDVKPANVLLAETGEILLTDFGIAVHETDASLTATGTLIGSVEYMAPERWNGGKAAASSDLFSLGATLFHAVEGSSPFHRDTPTAALAAVLTHQVPPSPRAGRPLAGLIGELLTKDPDRRPTVATALSLLDTETGLLDTETGPLIPPPKRKPTKVLPPSRLVASKKPTWARSLGGLVLGLYLLSGMWGIVLLTSGDTSAFTDGGAFFFAVFLGGMSFVGLAVTLMPPLLERGRLLATWLFGGVVAALSYIGILPELSGQLAPWKPGLAPLVAIAILVGVPFGAGVLINKSTSGRPGSGSYDVAG